MICLYIYYLNDIPIYLLPKYQKSLIKKIDAKKQSKYKKK